MGRVEVEDTSLQAHALNEGVSDTMLEGSLRLDRTGDGVAAVLELRTVGKKTDVTNALLDLVMRSFRSRNLVVTHDGEEVRPEVNDDKVLRRASAPRKLPALKRLPMSAPRLLGEDSSDPGCRTVPDGGTL